MASTRLPHDEAGSGPALVLLHAGIADRTMWTEQLPALAAAGWRAIAPDLPGFGEAPPAERDAPWEDVVATLDALGVDRAVLAGVSYGGAVALRVAVTAPDRVAALALISAPPPALEPSPELAAEWEREEQALERGDVEAALAAVVETWLAPDAPPELRARVAAMQRRAYELHGIGQAGEGEGDDGEDEEEIEPIGDPAADLGRLALPVLVAAGERDKPDFVAGARRMADWIPGARHELIAGAGHLAPLETPEAFRELLLGFLAGARR